MGGSDNRRWWTSIVLATVVGLGAGAGVAVAATGHGRRAPATSALQVVVGHLRDNRRAFNLYMVHCGGCHRADGRGVPDYGVPSFVDSAAVFTWLSAGRQYLIRVPGSAFSFLSDEQLAEVLNWIVATYSPRQLPATFMPYTSAEVARYRNLPYRDVTVARARVDKKLDARGLRPSRYTFGRGDRVDIEAGR